MSAEIEKLASLRNERKPCHFWVDNEVADCYQPIVGADAIWVYCRIARYANGAWIVSPRLRGTSDTRVGLREMAEWCGKSVDTVARSLEVLELVGLVRSERGGARSKGRYALADVKDLVIREGGQYDREIGGYRLPGERVAELAEEVRQLRLKLSRKGQLRIVEESPENVEKITAEQVDGPGVPRGATVALSDRREAEEELDLDAGSDSCVPLERQNCTAGATDINLLEDLKTSRTKQHPPAPLAAAMGEMAQKEIALEVDRVCHRIGVVANRRERGMLCGVMRGACERMGKTAAEVGELMAARWERQAAMSQYLRVKLGLRKFYSQGYWENENRWFWDEEKWRLHCEAKVGTWG